MIITGYEQPVEMPSMGVYDTDLMKMYMSEVKNQYEKGQEEMKDFMKLYQDFYSDVPGATDLYNQMTIGGARDLINNMYAQGIDPFKSPEARAKIRQYIYGVPTGELNRMKKASEDAKEYIKSRNALIAKGQWDPDFERFVLGGQLLEEWDGTKGPWTATAATPSMSMEQLTHPEFEKFKAIEDLGPSRPGYRKKGTSQQNQDLAVSSALKELDRTPQGRYQRVLAKRQVEAAAAQQGITLSPEQLEKLTDAQLEQNVRETANKYFQPTEGKDELYFQERQIAANAREKALDRAQAERHFNMRYNPKDPNYVEDPSTPKTRTPLSQQIIDSSNEKINQSARSYVDGWKQNLINKAVEWRKNNPIENGKKMKSPEEARTWWENALNDPVSYGLMNEKGEWTNTAKTWFNRTGVKASDLDNYNSLANRKELAGKPNMLRNAADKIYDMYSGFVPESPSQKEYLNKVFTGTSLYTVPHGEYQKVAIMNSGKHIHYTPVRRITIAGGKQLIDVLQKNFDNFLRNRAVTLYKRGDDINTAAIPKANGKSSIDLFAEVDMKKEDFKAFCDKFGYTEEYAMKALGLKIYRSDNRYAEAINENKGKYKPLGSKDYVRIPITRTILNSSNPSYDSTGFDEEWEKIITGTTGVQKMAVPIETYSLGYYTDED